MLQTRFRVLFLVCSVAWAARASAFGLGELHTGSHLGERLVADVDLIIGNNEKVDLSCFRLRAPAAGGDLPWLRHAALELRGNGRRLSIASDQLIREPLMQIGISVGCGFDAQRDYTIFLNPLELSSPVSAPATGSATSAPAREVKSLASLAAKRFPASKSAQRRYIAALRAANPELAAYGSNDSLPAGIDIPDLPAPAAGAVRANAERPLPRKERVRDEKPLAMAPLLGAAKESATAKSGGDRLVLLGTIDDPELKVAGELSSWGGETSGAPAAEREMLRLEYRMMALHDQQAAMLNSGVTPERVAAMNQDIESLRQQMAILSAEVAPPAPASTVTPTVAEPAARKAPAEGGAWGDWLFYGAGLLAVGGLAGFLAWQRTRQRRRDEHLMSALPPEPYVDPLADSAANKVIDFDDDFSDDSRPAPPSASEPLPVAGNDEQAASPPPMPLPEQAIGPFSELLSQRGPHDGTTLDEQFAANPVMELAEIMLSFGRVKGAAQALQEYVDNNPGDAVVPWLKLLDIYRMAGMREEFERLAPRLSAHFNIEIQKWENKPLTDTVIDGAGGGLSLAPLEHEVVEQERVAAATLENMPHIRERLVRSWGTRDCLDYMHQLLRDNRGGTRAGFPLPVVQELLFLIELQEAELKEGDVLLPDIDLS